MANLCPFPDVWRSYLRGESSDELVDALEAHLAGCQGCQTQVEQLSEESDAFIAQVAEAVAAGGLWECGGQMVAEASQTQNGIGDMSHGSNAAKLTYLPNPNEMIRDYRVLTCIGQGGMGRVYRALHVRLNKFVALKILNSDRIESNEAVSRFAREMRLLAQLEHPGIVRALDAGEHEGLPYFVMDFVTGVDLGKLVQHLGPLPVAEACHIVRLAAAALQFAHDQKVIHRDVKPSNLMITTEGTVKLLDLGLAQIFDLKNDDSITRDDQTVGTLAYMAPEQLSSGQSVSKQSDIFSLGVTLHELLTGRRPMERLHSVCFSQETLRLCPDAPPELLELVQQMLAFSPLERPPSMSEIEERLAAIIPPAELSALVRRFYCSSKLPEAPPVQTSELDGLTRPVSGSSSLPSPSTITNTQSAMDSSKSELAERSRNSRWLTAIAVLGSLSTILLVIALAYEMGRNGRLGSMSAASSPVPGANQSSGANADAGQATDAAHASTAGDSSPAMGKFRVSAYPGLASHLLSEFKVKLIRLDTNETFGVTPELKELPIGDYKIQFNAPVDLQQDGTHFVVDATTINHLELRATLTKPFQFPDIPSEAGAYAAYYGSIWRVGWTGSEPVAFTLKLELMAVDTEANAPVSKWLMIEAHTDSGEERFEETAYLKIDAKSWETSQSLEIEEGWVEAKSKSLDKFISEFAQNPSVSSVIVPFDASRDLIASIDGIPLPHHRLSIHDFISLFFGEDTMSAAAEPIRKLRPMLTSFGDRQEWLDDTNSALGSEPAYIVSSRKKGESTANPHFLMARRRSSQFNPFGFVKLEVKSPGLVATCVLKNANVSEADAQWTKRELSQLRKNEFQLKPNMMASAGPIWGTSPPNPNTGSGIRSDREKQAQNSQHSDMASLPDAPAFASWQGVVTHRTSDKETIHATARMLGVEMVGGREFRWIEVEVNSRSNDQDHWEAARVLVDASEYNTTQDFRIERGWVAYDRKEFVFALPADLNLETLVDARLLLQNEAKFDSFGVVDAMSMLFGAKLKPRTTISTLRETIAGAMPGTSRVWQPYSLTLKSRQYHGDRLISPIISPIKYSIFRSSQVPFGFVSVAMNVPLALDIGLEVDGRHGPLPTDYSYSVFGTPAQLEQLSATAARKIQTRNLPNWAVWSWHERGKTYKVWAEFGGIIESTESNRDVLLRDRMGRETRVPEKLLSDASVAKIRSGRIWLTFSNDQQRVLDSDHRATHTLRFRIPAKSDQPIVYGSEYLHEDDRLWLAKLRAAKQAKWNPALRAEQWKEFATYVR